MYSSIDKYFNIKDSNTNIKKEFFAGIATFFAISYIIIVNPKILSAAGMPINALATSTVLVSFLASVSMGLYTRNPFVIAPGMGMNIFFSYTAVNTYHLPWQSVLGATFWSGLIFTLLVIFNIRVKIMQSLPKSVKNSLGAGIGLFIAYIGLVNGGFITSNNGLLEISKVSAQQIIFIICMISLIILFIKKIPAPILLVIIFGCIVCYTSDLLFHTSTINIPSHIIALPDFSLVSQIDLAGGFKLSIIPTIFTFCFLSLFDGTGTIASLYGSMNKNHDIKDKELKKTFLVDSGFATISGILGTSPSTVVVESGVGIAQGGKTGLTAVFAGLCFLPFLFLAPLISAVPLFVVSPALILIGIMMMQQVIKVDWNDLLQAIPAFFTILMMTLSSSISSGIACGIVVWFVVAIFANKKEINKTAIIITLLCLFMFLHTISVF